MGTSKLSGKPDAGGLPAINLRTQTDFRSLFLTPPKNTVFFGRVRNNDRKSVSDGLASLPGGVAILLVVSCYTNRDILR